MDLLALAAAFALCTAGPRTTCVVDGDTFWLNGEKVRIADINAPETHEAGCAEERALGQQAARRLVALLNGRSLSAALVAEGLAEPWRGRRSDWCAMLAGGTEAG